MGRLGVVLDAEGRLVEQLEAFDDVVVQADVGDLGAAVGGLGDLVEGRVDGEAVVVRGDLDLAGGAVLDRLVDAAVAVLQLVGAEAERAAQDLVAEADAEERGLALQHALHDGDGAVGGGRVARAVGEEHAVGPDRVHVLDGGGGGQHVHLDAALGHPVRGHALDAEVDGGDGEALLADRGDDVRLLGGDLGGEVRALHLRLRPDLGQQGLVADADPGLAGEDADAHGAELAQVAGEGAGVDAGDPDDALLRELLVQRAPGAPVGGDAGGVAYDVASTTQMREDSGSSSLTPVLPTWGAVITTTCRWYDGSVRVSW